MRTTTGALELLTLGLLSLSAVSAAANGGHGGARLNDRAEGHKQLAKRAASRTLFRDRTTATTTSAAAPAASSSSKVGWVVAAPATPVYGRTTTTTSSAPVQTTAFCSATYSAPTTIRGTGTLPKPTSFVTRSGQQLKVGNQNFRIAGPNIYWLCSDENASPWAAPPDKGRVREAMAIAVAMGANTIRIHTCGISVGPNSPYSWEPSKGVFREDIAQHRDFVLYTAREYGLRVILPLLDNYNYYHGGKQSFVDFFGLSTANHAAKFYESKVVIAAFGEYITKFLSRVNTYTGVSYANDPSILAWETGNELGGYIQAEMWPPASWTNYVINYIRSVDKRHLIIDGTNGFWNYSTNATPDGLRLPGIDIVSDHGYPRNGGILSKEIALAKAANKAFIVGEYDWRANGGGTALGDYLSMIEGAGLGDLLWSVLGRDAQCCAFVPHNDGYSLYYPDGNPAADQAAILQVVKHWYKVTGRAQPSKLPAVACPQPEF
ncbi:hypothetical protein JCM8097_008195 [Rhodosporidiobolus ruineniae]